MTRPDLAGELAAGIPDLPAALCRNFDPDLWFDERLAKTAGKICARCPERAACLSWAIRHGERHGVWGGKTPYMRGRITGRRRRARLTPPAVLIQNDREDRHVDEDPAVGAPDVELIHDTG